MSMLVPREELRRLPAGRGGLLKVGCVSAAKTCAFSARCFVALDPSLPCVSRPGETGEMRVFKFKIALSEGISHVSLPAFPFKYQANHIASARIL